MARSNRIARRIRLRHMTLPVAAQTFVHFGAPARRKARQRYSTPKPLRQPATERRGGPEPSGLGFDGGIGGEFAAASLPQRRLLTQASVENVVEPAARLACDSTASVAFRL